jgi:hypothetical protein
MKPKEIGYIEDRIFQIEEYLSTIVGDPPYTKLEAECRIFFEGLIYELRNLLTIFGDD